MELTNKRGGKKLFEEEARKRVRSDMGGDQWSEREDGLEGIWKKEGLKRVETADWMEVQCTIHYVPPG
jgi:hypothetical protein